MCVKLPSKDLNLGPYLPRSINTYTYEVTIVPRVCGGTTNLNVKGGRNLFIGVNKFTWLNFSHD